MAGAGSVVSEPLPSPTSPSISAHPVMTPTMTGSSPTTTPTSLPHHRSTPPPPPYILPISPPTPHSTSMSRPPTYDPSSSSSSSSSSTRPGLRRISSQSDFTHSTSRSSISTSTAPTSPNLSMHGHHQPMHMGNPQRQWRPTTNVPSAMTLRHHRPNRSIDAAVEEERNRWLSEDEGLDGVARSIGRRRRRRSSGDDDQQPPDNRGPDPDRPPDRSTLLTQGGPAPITHQRRLQDKANFLATASASGSGSRSKSAARPKPRRVQSHETSRRIEQTSSTSTLGAEDVTVGSNPPNIRDIVAGPTSPVVAMNSNVGDTIFAADHGITPMAEVVPDYAAGRGGDSISEYAVPLPIVADNEVLSQRQEQDALLQKLKRILGCAFCPPREGQSVILHHPITLPCGHTMSSQHIILPTPPPLVLNSDLPHEIYAAEQRRHQQRLNLWAGVMCPIPSCKRYSPSASASVVDTTSVSIHSPSRSVSSGAQRGEMLASGVTYYPPPMPAPPAYTQDPPSNAVDPSSHALLDISVDKIIQLVKRETERSHNELTSMRGGDTDTEADSDDDEGRTGLSRDMSDMGYSMNHGPTSPLSRRISKRRRNVLAPPPVRLGSPDEWPFRKELSLVLECDVCAMMLHEPVTTPCQHSFCSKCLSRSLDHSSRCPLCRQDLPSFAFFQDHAINRVLLSIIKTVFPGEYAERCASIEREERDARLDTPIFVCTLAFPGMPTILHVFEPRYRLMIRRCIESSSPRFGMVLPSRATGPTAGGGLQGVMEYGTLLEIQSVQMLPDGRSMVETVGTHRFKLLEKGNLDGYTVGRIERIDDISVEEDAQLQESAMRDVSLRGTSAPSVAHPIQSGSGPTGMSFPVPSGPPTDDTLQTTEEYMNICRSFIDQLRSGSAPWLLQRLNNTYGTMPTDPSEFSYWMALVMPIDEYEKARLLPIRSPRLRLKLIVHWVESLRSSWWFSSGCVLE